MWIVMTSNASMPSSCKGRYRNVAVVQITDELAASGQVPTMISERARGVVSINHYGPQSVGSTARCAYNRTLAYATAEAAKLNIAAHDAKLNGNA